MTEEQFIEITKWQKETFGEATSLSKLLHLEEEIKEVILDLHTGNKERNLEFADCFILLFGAAASDGMDYSDICNAVETKMAINRKRKWGKPDENGVVNHIKD